MKLVASTLTFFALFFFLGCEKEDKPKTNLSGKWIGMGYQCVSGVYHIEEVQIVHDGEDISAIKITGDPCVPAGSQTFKGTWDNDSQSAEITWTTGKASSPGCCSANGSLKFTGCTLYGNSGTGEAIKFIRIDGNDAVNYDVPNEVFLVPQPNDVTCWAASTAMMIMWRDNASYPISTAMASVGSFWKTKFEKPVGLSDVEWNDFTNAVGLQSKQFSPSVKGINELLKNGPLLIAIDEDPSVGFSPHAKIVTGIYGDGSPECTYLNVIDPWPPTQGKRYTESYQVFMEKIGQLAKNSNFIPIHHW